jgi:hypothetical protein
MIGALYEAAGFTQEQYDAVLQQVGDAQPEGALVHIAGPTDDGWRVIEVWESEATQQRFQEDLLNPAFDRAGAPRVTPTFFPVHMIFPTPEAIAALAAGGGAPGG